MLPMRFFRNRAFSARERRLALHVLRHVRLDLPALAVLPDRAGLLAARGRAADPAVDGDADLHRADRRCAVGPDRRPAVHRGRARAAGDRARLDRVRLDARRRLLALVGPFIMSGIGMALFFAPVANVVLVGGRRGAKRARRRAPTTRSASSAASSASPCWPRSSRARAATAARASSTGLIAALSVGAAVVGVGADRARGPRPGARRRARRTRARARPRRLKAAVDVDRGLRKWRKGQAPAVPVPIALRGLPARRQLRRASTGRTGCHSAQPSSHRPGAVTRPRGAWLSTRMASASAG